MTQAKTRFTTFEDYLAFEDGSDQLYELLHGELIALPPESGRNIIIIDFLYAVLIQVIDFWRVRRLGLELEVPGEPKNRYPDLTIIREEHIQQLEHRNTVRLSMQPPLVVVEAVSPGQKNRERDYIDKRQQYQEREIPEYWLIDPIDKRITVLVLQDGAYQELGVFQDSASVYSPYFPNLGVTAAQILQARF